MIWSFIMINYYKPSKVIEHLYCLDVGSGILGSMLVGNEPRDRKLGVRS